MDDGSVGSVFLDLVVRDTVDKQVQAMAEKAQATTQKSFAGMEQAISAAVEKAVAKATKAATSAASSASRAATQAADAAQKAVQAAASSATSCGQQVENTIEQSFSKSVAIAQSKVTQLEKAFDAVTDKLNSQWSGDTYDPASKATQQLLAQQEKLMAQLEAAQDRLTIEVQAAAQKRIAAEEIANRKAVAASQKAAAVQEREARKNEILQQKVAHGAAKAHEQSAARIKNAFSKAFSGARKMASGFGNAVSGIRNKLSYASKSATRFDTRLKSIISGALVFNLLSSALRKMTDYLGTAIGSSSEMKDALANLKGAAMTAAQPIVEMLTPALTALANGAATVLSYLTRLISFFTGKTVSSMSSAAKKIQGTANTAKKAMASLAGFDEIQKLDSKDSSGGDDAAEVKPNFDFQGQSSFLDSVMESVKAGNWGDVGALLSKKLNSCLNSINWPNIQKKASSWVSGVVAGINGFVQNLDWGRLGATLSSGLSTAIATLRTAITTFDWFSLGKGVADGIDGIDWVGLLSDAAGCISDALRGATDLLMALKNQLAATTPDAPGYAELKKQYEDMLRQYPTMSIFKDLDGKIQKAKTDIYNTEKAIKYCDLSSNVDYEEKSRFEGEGDRTQHLVNNQESAGKWDTAWTVQKYLPIIPGMETLARVKELWGYENLHLMEESERKNFNYLYNTQGEDAAKEYLDWLQYTLDARSKEKVQSWVADRTRDVPVLSQAYTSLLSTPIALLSGEGILDAAAQKAISSVSGEWKPVNYNRDGMMASVASSTIRNTVGSDIQQHLGTVAAKAYQLGMSMQDSAAIAGLTMINPALGKMGTMLLGGASATQTMLDAAERGASDEQAIGLGLLSGAFEIFFEKYELDELLDNVKYAAKGAGKGALVKTMARQALSEGVGEGATEIANILADCAVMAEKSNWQLNIEKYITEKNMSPKEAKKQAFIDAALQVGEAVVGGLISGSVSSSAYTGVQTLVKNASYAKTGATIMNADGGVEALINSAHEVAGVSSEDVRNTLMSQIDQVSQNPTARNIGQLYATIQTAGNEADASVTPEDVTKMLRSKRVNSKTTASIADAIAARLNGQELTKTQRERLRSALGSPAVQSVISDMQKTLTSRSDNVSQKPTTRNVGQLNTTVQAASDQVNTSINQADVAESLKGKGIPSQKIDTHAVAIVARVNGQELTRTQRDVLRSELSRPSVQKVINELIQKKSNGVDSPQSAVYDGSNIRDGLADEEKTVLWDLAHQHAGAFSNNDNATATESSIPHQDQKTLSAETDNGGRKAISQLLKDTTCRADELFVYLSKQVGSDAAEAFAKNRTWPSEVQIPKNSSALNLDGSMNWSRAPQGGYTLDANGNAIKEVFVPKIGEVIDRYGAVNGRYASPVIDGKAFSYSERALPYVEDVSKYHRYEVIGDFTKIEEYVKNCENSELKAKIDAAVTAYYDGDYSKLVSYRGEVAGIEDWGKGGATQYEFSLSIEQLVELGLLKEIR